MSHAGSQVEHRKEKIFMSRIQFYPDKELLAALDNDSKRLGVAVSMLVTDILKRHYGLVPESALSETELNSKVFEEIKTYVDALNSRDEFDLVSASKTFRQIDMVYSGRPSTLRAKIGKNFAKAVDQNPDFSNIEVVRLHGDRIKRNYNNAAIYRIK